MRKPWSSLAWSRRRPAKREGHRAADPAGTCRGRAPALAARRWDRARRDRSRQRLRPGIFRGRRARDAAGPRRAPRRRRGPDGRADRRPGRAPGQDRVHRPQLRRPRRRVERGDADRAGRVLQGARTPSSGRTTTSTSRAARPRPTGRSSWPSSSGGTCRYLASEAEALGRVAGLHGRPRRVGARIPARARRPVGQGQVVRDVQPGRARGW